MENQASKIPLALEALKTELLAELRRINHFWLNDVISEESYCGQVSADGVREPNADKGIILATRMLWYFSEAAMYLEEYSLRCAADKIYCFICDYFIDTRQGGVFWMLNAKGQVKNDRKQVYAQAFAIYAFSAYFRLSKNPAALEHARRIFALLETHAFDQVNGGYFEAFSHDWGFLHDIRLSTKDLPSPKTMNTHLHLLEAYTGLLRAEKIAGSDLHLMKISTCLIRLLNTYKERFFDADTKHLRMFMGNTWFDESSAYSFGHDIESSWLIWEAVTELHSHNLKPIYQATVDSLIQTTIAEGLASNAGSVYDMVQISTGHIEKARIWWVQAEALVGFFNAWQITRNDQYLNYVFGIWEFIRQELLDRKHGEWHWTATCDTDPKVPSHYKVGPWKGPYHNGRAMLELCRRIDDIHLE
jgi:N-acyl-D-glucosamine 2-epimerase